jgi:hypothetical protein
LRTMRQALRAVRLADNTLEGRCLDLEAKLRDRMRVLTGDRTLLRRSEPTTPALLERVSLPVGSTGPVTATIKADFAIAASEFGALLEEVRTLIERDLKKLAADVEAAGAPWSPGRGVPQWQKK